jgi:hypothetical protein
MELSPSRETTSCAATEEPPNSLWNLKLQYRAHKGPPLFPILSHIYPYVQILCKMNKHYNEYIATEI